MIGWISMGVLLLLGLSLSSPPVLAQVLSGATVEQRAINGAKGYSKTNNLKNPSLTMLVMSFLGARDEMDVSAGGRRPTLARGEGRQGAPVILW